MLLAVMAIAGCNSQNNTSSANSAIQDQAAKPKVEFNGDSAYVYTAQQVAFGPRVPNTQAHRLCGDWLVAKLNQFGAANIKEQQEQLTAYDGTKLQARNITAQFNPDATKRILLLSHWDSRPWADHDPNPEKRNQPIDGANDGASGVGVILEIARLLSQQQPRIGVDILLTDAEDYGTRADADVEDSESSWCLGTQYWVANPTLDLQKIHYGILLDMVGGKGAKFKREYFSQRHAPEINDKVWKTAQNSGFGNIFVNGSGTPIIDDHIYLLQAGIPVVDIIETDHPSTGGFNPVWHTHNDNIDNIDSKTLRAVGQTITDLIYNE